jgi:hypothetical protein
MDDPRRLDGVIDMHVHAWPDNRPRLLDVFEVAEQARDVGMKAVVIKNHHASTVDLAALASRRVRGVDIFGGVVLNRSVGGFNPYAVEYALQLGAKVIWMPTVSSKLDTVLAGNGDGLSLYRNEQNSGLRDEVGAILDIMATKNAVLATGHLTPDETLHLFEESSHLGVRKFLVNHPEESSINMSLACQKALADRGAYIEYCFNYCTPRKSQRTLRDYVEYIRYIGPERCILATDLGQIDNFLPVDGLRVFIQALTGAGIPAAWIRQMTIENPHTLLYS